MENYIERINLIHRDLGITENYGREFGLMPQQEEFELVEIENDIYGRSQRLAPVAAKAWQAMKTQAANEGVILRVVSAFRGADRQKEIIENKIMAGQAISEILKACAAPGYSEHHTGRALDLTSTECKPLTEDFENKEAFIWLMENASFYSFSLTYPKGNKGGIFYEPWHWAYSQE
ncbi:MAG: M15 family metallopeptidase [Candidatus Thiodiazotropha taylori]